MTSQIMKLQCLDLDMKIKKKFIKGHLINIVRIIKNLLLTSTINRKISQLDLNQQLNKSNLFIIQICQLLNYKKHRERYLATVFLK